MDIITNFFSVFLGFALAMTLTPKRFWWVKVLDAMRLHLVVLCFLTGGWYLWFSDFDIIDMLLMLGLFGFAIYYLPSLLYFTPLAEEEVPKAMLKGATFDCISINVRMSNSAYDKLTALVIKEQPDLILLTEVDQTWIDKIKVLEKLFKYKLLAPKDNTYGMAVYSKWPFSFAEVKYLTKPDIPSVHLIVESPDGYALQFIGLHPRPPAPSSDRDEKDLELIQAAALTNNNLKPTLVAGDLNDVAWSKATKEFKVISELLDPRVGRGFFNTYNVFFPGFRIPIDHFFVSEHFELIEMKRLSAIGSDHFPVKISLQYK